MQEFNEDNKSSIIKDTFIISTKDNIIACINRSNNSEMNEKDNHIGHKRKREKTNKKIIMKEKVVKMKLKTLSKKTALLNDFKKRNLSLEELSKKISDEICEVKKEDSNKIMYNLSELLNTVSFDYNSEDIKLEVQNKDETKKENQSNFLQNLNVNSKPKSYKKVYIFIISFITLFIVFFTLHALYKKSINECLKAIENIISSPKFFIPFLLGIYLLGDIYIYIKDLHRKN